MLQYHSAARMAPLIIILKKMKKFRLLITTTLLVLVVVSFNSVAQTANSDAVPTIVVSSFQSKYPGATIKKWKSEKDKYIAKAEINNRNCFATFDRNGKWVNTISKVRGERKLPKAVYEAYQKSAYKSWNVYFIKEVEKPSGDYYHVVVNDRNARASSDNQALFNTHKLLDFKADGVLAEVVDVSNNPAADPAAD